MERLEAMMATELNKDGLDEIRRKMIALKSAIEDYVDGLDMDDVDSKKARKASKETEEKEA